jgi:hypothetical protein
MGIWAQPADVGNAWRTLSPDEETRAPYLIDTVERAIVRQWPNTSDRITDGDINPLDVRDVIVWSVIAILGVSTDVPVNAKSYQTVSGMESVTVTLDGPATDQWLTFQPWMVDVFEGGATATTPLVALPGGSFPTSVLGVADWLTSEPGDPQPWQFGEGWGGHDGSLEGF